jgi:hypothetical protein
MTSTDGLDSQKRQRLFGGFNKKVFKPFRAVGRSSEPPTNHTQEPVPAPGKLVPTLKQPTVASKSSPAQIEQPAGEAMTSRDTSSIRSLGAGPISHPSRPSFWRKTRSLSPALQVTTVAAGRARRVRFLLRSVSLMCGLLIYFTLKHFNLIVACGEAAAGPANQKTCSIIET